MTKLSPSAQAVLDAYWNYPWDPARQHEDRGSIAAALRATAGQVPYLAKNCSSYDVNVQDGREEVRSFLFTIANELEAQ